MTCQNNVTKGRQKVFLCRNNANTAWEIIGGVKERGESLDNPTEDVTSSSTTGSFSEKEQTGYKSLTLNLSGVADKRTGIADPTTGYNIVGQVRLRELAYGPGCGTFKLVNIDDNSFVSGDFTITNYSETGSSPGLLNWSATFESTSDAING